MPQDIAHLRARALVARSLARQSRDTAVANLLIQISEEFEEEAPLREMAVPGSEPTTRGST